MSETTNPNNQNNWQKLVLGAVAIALGVALALGIKAQPPAATLEAQAEAAVSLDVALANEKPTMVEFYADWCTSCQAMAEDLRQIKGSYGDRLKMLWDG